MKKHNDEKPPELIADEHSIICSKLRSLEEKVEENALLWQWCIVFIFIIEMIMLMTGCTTAPVFKPISTGGLALKPHTLDGPPVETAYVISQPQNPLKLADVIEAKQQAYVIAKPKTNGVRELSWDNPPATTNVILHNLSARTTNSIGPRNRYMVLGLVPGSTNVFAVQAQITNGTLSATSITASAVAYIPPTLYIRPASFEYSWACFVGKTNVLETTTNISAAWWTDVLEFVGTNGVAVVTLPATNRQQFYRVKVRP